MKIASRTHQRQDTRRRLRLRERLPIHPRASIPSAQSVMVGESAGAARHEAACFGGGRSPDCEGWSVHGWKELAVEGRCAGCC